MSVSDADVSLLLTKLTLSPRGYPGVGNLEVSNKPAVKVTVARKRKRKQVRFADALGLKLYEEKIFDKTLIPLTFIEEFEENNDFLLFKNAYRPPVQPDKPSVLCLVPVCVPTSDVTKDRVRADRIQLEKAWSVERLPRPLIRHPPGMSQGEALSDGSALARSRTTEVILGQCVELHLNQDSYKCISAQVGRYPT